MKNRILLSLGAVALFWGSASNACDNSIAASPKMRQMLDEQCADCASCAWRDAGYIAVGDDGIVASPKMRQILDERQPVFGGTGTALDVSTGASYQVVGDDGVAASPKMRQLLDEQKLSPEEVAPLK